jgi:hypothetical protein
MNALILSPNDASALDIVLDAILPLYEQEPTRAGLREAIDTLDALLQREKQSGKALSGPLSSSSRSARVKSPPEPVEGKSLADLIQEATTPAGMRELIEVLHVLLSEDIAGESSEYLKSPADLIREAMREASKMPPDEAQRHVAKANEVVEMIRSDSRKAKAQETYRRRLVKRARRMRTGKANRTSPKRRVLPFTRPALVDGGRK